jgi:NitT/TauT family transport system permease protein
MTRAARVRWARVGVVVAAILLLEAACRLELINPLTLIPPSDMAAAMFQMIVSGEITDDIIHTFSAVGVAAALSVVIGLVTGTVIHSMPRVRSAIAPFLASYYAVPVFVFYPLLVALFGLTMVPLIAIAFIAAVPAMVIATLTGLDRVPLVLRKVARVHRMGAVRTALLVVLPATLPSLCNGIKLCLAYAFIGVIAGEFILSSGGLGYGIAYAYESFENRPMYGRMLFVLLVAAVINGVLHAWEVRMNHRCGRA